MIKRKLFLLGVFLSLFAFSATVHAALIPIARFDVIPYQRINTGETFKAGVIAFSKPGIDKVTFTISGQGYSGTSPINVTKMSLNNQTGVWEYWTPISGSSFSSDGEFTISATVTDKEGNVRNIEPIVMFANPKGTLKKYEIWVDGTTGNDTNCAVNNSGAKCKTIPGAISKIQSANPDGVSDGSVIYLEEGTYSVGSKSDSIVIKEWLTVTKSASAKEESVIINSGGSALKTGNVKIKDIKLVYESGSIFSSWQTQWSGASTYSKGDLIQHYPDPRYNAQRYNYVSKQNNNIGHEPGVAADWKDWWELSYLWVDSSTLIGKCNVFCIGQTGCTQTTNTGPVDWAYYNKYLTNNYITNVDNVGGWGTKIIRGNTVYGVGRDFCNDCGLMVNNKADYQWNNMRSAAWHGDFYQFSALNRPPIDNIIIYGNIATNWRNQGFFTNLSSTPARATNVAVVNNHIEEVDPGVIEELGEPVQSPYTWGYGTEGFDHLLIWHNSITGIAGHAGDYGVHTNASVIGNLFTTFQQDSANHRFDYGNPYGNEMLYNHYEYSYDDAPGVTCALCDSYVSKNYTCPRPLASSPDSGNPPTDTFGPANIKSEHEPIPLSNETKLVNRLPIVKVPIDVLGNLRDNTPDIGAYEYSSGSTPPPATCSDGIQNQGETGVDCGGPCAACSVPTYQCNDGTDNDGDGLIDYPSDPGCSSATDDDEYNAPLPDTQAPTVPAGLAASVVSTSQINLSWNASSDNTGVAGYNLYRCTGTTCTPTTKVVTTTGTGFVNMGLTQNTTYQYRVNAFDAAGNTSGYSNVVVATTQSEPVYACNDGIDNDGDGLIDYPNDPGCAALIDNDEYDPPVEILDTQAPSTPSGFSSSNVTDSSLTLSWASSTDTVGVVGYNIYRCAGFRCTPVKIATVPFAKYADAGLQSRTKYYYQVTAFDAAGNVSKYSSKYSVTTKRVRSSRFVSSSGLSSMFASLFFGAKGMPDDTLSKLLVGVAFLGVAVALVLYAKQRTQKKWLFFRRTSMQGRIVLYVVVGVVVLVVLLMML